MYSINIYDPKHIYVPYTSGSEKIGQNICPHKGYILVEGNNRNICNK